jgi:excisionase family DNA binding protein
MRIDSQHEGQAAKGHAVPTLLTPSEVAELLRTSKAAVYAMVERGQLPGVVRIGRRVLVHQEALVDWLGQKSTPSLGGRER